MLMRLLTLRAAAVLAAVDDELQVDSRELALQPCHHVDGGVVAVRDAEYDLEARIVLIAERAQAFVQLVLRAAQRLQDRHRRRRAGARGRMSREARAHREPRPPAYTRRPPPRAHLPNQTIQTEAVIIMRQLRGAATPGAGVAVSGAVIIRVVVGEGRLSD